MMNGLLHINSGLLLLLCFVSYGCGGSSQSLQGLSTEERFNKAMAHLENGDYDKAQELYEVIILQDPASEYADDAQFYLAETYFRDGEYRLAAYNYSRLVRSFPGSSFFKRALFQAGECYFRVSPPYERDQNETKNAIEQFDVFTQYFPNDSLSSIANDRIFSLRTKLAQREYYVATHYLGRGEYSAATIYLQRIIDDYADTKYYQNAVDELREAEEKIREREAEET